MKWYHININRLMMLTSIAALVALMSSLTYRAFLMDGWDGVAKLGLIAAVTWTILGLTFKVSSLLGQRDALQEQRDHYRARAWEAEDKLYAVPSRPGKEVL